MNEESNQKNTMIKNKMNKKSSEEEGEEAKTKKTRMNKKVKKDMERMVAKRAKNKVNNKNKTTKMKKMEIEIRSGVELGNEISRRSSSIGGRRISRRRHLAIRGSIKIHFAPNHHHTYTQPPITFCAHFWI